MEQIIRRLFVALALCFVLTALPFDTLQTARAMSYYEPYDVVLGAVRSTFSLDMWHYSGGYWMVDDGMGNRVKVLDKDMGRAGISGTLSLSQSARWSIVLPKAVRDAALDGKKIKTKLEFSSSLINDAHCEVSPTGSGFVYAKPVFHVATSATLNSFVPGIAATIPLVDRNYGSNLYALYWMNVRRMTASGLFVDSSPSNTFEPYMHPAFIINSQGTLKPGLKIKADGKEYDSGLLSVGSLTLERGGAVGLRFDFPIKVTFYAEELREVTKDPPQTAEDKPGGNEGTEPPGGTEPKPAPEETDTMPDPEKTPEPSPKPNSKPQQTKPGETPSPNTKPTSKPSGGGTKPPDGKPGEPPDDQPPEKESNGFDIRDFHIHRVY